MEDKVDFVFPYVDASDVFWQDKYFNTIGKMPDKDSSRYRSDFNLKPLFRSIEQNTDFIRSVVMIVDSESQVPKWLDKSKVRIVCHNEFIPKEKLPTFNSDTIEMYLPKIQGLTEHFLYGNDDMLFNSHCSIEDFFTKDGKLKIEFSKKNSANTLFLKMVWRQFCYIRDKTNSVFETNCYQQPRHCIAPMSLSLMNECFDAFKQDIDDSCTTLRDCSRNFNQYLYQTYSEFKGQTDRATTTFGYYNMSKTDFRKAIADIWQRHSQTICLNDTPSTSVKAAEEVQKALMGRYYLPSVYEVS